MKVGFFSRDGKYRNAGKLLTSNKYKISPLNALVYLPSEYKLKSEYGNSDFLDFSRNTNERYK